MIFNLFTKGEFSTRKENIFSTDWVLIVRLWGYEKSLWLFITESLNVPGWKEPHRPASSIPSAMGRDANH